MQSTTKNKFWKIEQLHKILFVKKKNTAHAAQRWFCRVNRRQNESGVLRDGTFFPRWLSAESGGYHGENHHFFSRIWNKGYHGSVGTSRWFCKIYHDKATIVRLLLKQLFFVDSFFPHHSCKVSQKENRAAQFINERTARLKGRTLLSAHQCAPRHTERHH